MAIGVLFEIDELSKLGGGQYGRPGWTIVMRACDPLRLTSCTLFSGDTLGGIFDTDKLYYCIGIQPLEKKQLEYFGEAMPDGIQDMLINPGLAKNQLEYFRETFLRTDDRGLLARERRFIEGDIADRHKLPIDGFIDPRGRFVMADTECYWLLEIAAKCGWKYLPSYDWLGKFAAEFALYSREYDGYSWPESFLPIAKQALAEAGRSRTMLTLRQHLDAERDRDTKRVCERRWKLLENEVFREPGAGAVAGTTAKRSTIRKWWQLWKRG